ncbi:MAG: 1-acyl-sn-glycerol-3-phosphate acyltransferase [Clostridia bacterium]|nr:1-acyl-sn-glycerol-3-phosphate acyltransferase [Clostridia bacterium]
MAEQKERTPLYTFARGVFGVLFRTLMPIRYHGTDKLNRQDAPYILISNHQAAIDPFVLALPVRRYEIRFIGKREIIGHKLVQWAVTQLHMIPVSRGATDMGAMRACMSALKEGHVLGIFPEGTRKLPEMMQTVESGTGMIALRANVPILPVYIQSKVRPFHVTHVYVGDPMDIADIRAQGMSNDSIQQVCDRIRQTFYTMRDDVNCAK